MRREFKSGATPDPKALNGKRFNCSWYGGGSHLDVQSPAVISFSEHDPPSSQHFTLEAENLFAPAEETYQEPYVLRNEGRQYSADVSSAFDLGRYVEGIYLFARQTKTGKVVFELAAKYSSILIFQGWVNERSVARRGLFTAGYWSCEKLVNDESPLR